MFSYKLHRVSRGRINSTPITRPNGFGFTPGLAVTANSWGKWVMSQPAPIFKPGHRLTRLSSYIWDQWFEYDLAKDLADRWGYVLNVGYGVDFANAIAQGQTTNPTSDRGKLCKLAITDPTRYPIGAGIRQEYPPMTQTPNAYILDGNNVRHNDYSPEASAADLLVATNFKLESLRAFKAAGMRIDVVYDGGENGLQVPVNAPAIYGIDPVVVAAKGNDSWQTYVSRKKAEHQKLIYDAVKADVPNRSVYVYYPNGANAYANIPDAGLYGWDYDQMFNIGDKPSGSVYFRDNFSGLSGMGNPTIRVASYYDQLTHHLTAVAEQIYLYGKKNSYDFVSGGWGRSNISEPPAYIYPDLSYKGFLKCMYALGSVGLVAGHFSLDGSVTGAGYPAYSGSVQPSWLKQYLAAGEIHARMSWFDDFIIEGDLVAVPGSNDRIKPWAPNFEQPVSVKIGANYVLTAKHRCFARKLPNINRWMVVVWANEQPGANNTVVDGTTETVYIRQLEGVEPIELVSRPQGSIYIIDKTTATTTVTLQDP